MFNNNLSRKKYRLLTLQITVKVSDKQKHQLIRTPITTASKENLYKEIKLLSKLKFGRINTSRYVRNPKKAELSTR